MDFDAVVSESVPALVVAVVSIVLGGALGGWITSRWELAKKRRETDLAAAEAFFAVHGEFYGIWQEWKGVRHWPGFPDEVERERHRWELFARSAAAQSRVEALVTKLATERTLTDDERTLIGCYRQAYRTLSKCIETGISLGVPLQRRPDGRVLDSSYEVWDRSGAPTYVTFKELATAVGALLARPGVTPSKEHAMKSMRAITANRYERPHWVVQAREVLGRATR
ncbi:hypothetical protein AB0B66_34135 [Catellatospora sp. NPDC049111]|uniref:hypothetical protein n=1 Tax=Catellatospora sp. NPDC049111 TaxID=3155271 RepID=UPI0033E8F227